MRTCILATGGIAACAFAVILLVFQIWYKFGISWFQNWYKFGINT